MLLIPAVVVQEKNTCSYCRVPALEKYLQTMNIQSIGDLCSLTEQEVHHLPIAQPKVLNVRRIMEQFSAKHRNLINNGIVFVGSVLVIDLDKL